MKAATPLRISLGLFSFLLFLAFATTGCSKKCDDQAAPAQADEQSGEARSTAASSLSDIDEERPSGVNLRNGEEGTPSGGDPNISDDGDDEADGEGSNKKRRQ